MQNGTSRSASCGRPLPVTHQSRLSRMTQMNLNAVLPTPLMKRGHAGEGLKDVVAANH